MATITKSADSLEAKGKTEGGLEKIRVADADVEELLKEILQELKKITLMISEITGEN